MQPVEKCLGCNRKIPVKDLSEHLEDCEAKPRIDWNKLSDLSSDDDFEIPQINFCRPAWYMGSSDSDVQVIEDTEDTMVQHALEESLQDAHGSNAGSSTVNRLVYTAKCCMKM